jgi:DNA-binding protein HU-beta
MVFLKRKEVFKMILWKDLIGKIAKNNEMTQKDVSTVIRSLSDVITSGDSLRIPGLGAFSWKKRTERMGRNPATGEAVTIPAHNRLSFKSASAVKALSRTTSTTSKKSKKSK